MTEAAALIRSTVDRILRLKEEIDAIQADIKEVYAEAKGHGLDKSALGALVAELRKVEKVGRDQLAEAETVLDLYRQAYEGGAVGTKDAPRAHPHTHAPAREEMKFSQPDHADEYTGSMLPGAPVGSPSVAGSAATASLDVVPALSVTASGAFPPKHLAGPSGSAPLGDIDLADDMPAFLRRSKPPNVSATA
jgi:uncharacterized protein (UPF0335 family)